MNKKTEFTGIIKIQKNKLQNLEKELKREFSLIDKYSSEMVQIEKDILHIDYPISGNFSMLQQYNLAMHNMKSDMQKLSEKRNKTEERINQIRLEMKNVDIELEKFKFIEDEVLKERRANLLKEESKELDEIATILYSINRNSKS